MIYVNLVCVCVSFAPELTCIASPGFSIHRAVQLFVLIDLSSKQDKMKERVPFSIIDIVISFFCE